MKLFISRVLIFLSIISSLILIVCSIFPSEEYRKLTLLNEKENMIIFMGDSKSLVALDYDLLKEHYPNRKIINISMWAQNPVNNFYLFKEKLKNLNNCLIIYSLTYAHIINRVNNNRSDILHFITPQFKTYPYKYTTNGFASINEDLDFKERDTKKILEYYNNFETNYYNDFNYEYLIKIKKIVEKDNIFLTSQFTHTTYHDSILNLFNNYTNFKSLINTSYNIDFGLINKLNHTKYWYNSNHLNSSGSNLFTPILINKLDSILYIKNSK